MSEDRKATHIDAEGKATMVDVSGKPHTARRALASGKVRMSPSSLKAVRENAVAKGDVLSAARIAGIMAAKNTAGLIPLCHPLGLNYCGLQFEITDTHVGISAEVRVYGPTGVEMEALAAVTVAALTIYDMCKALDKDMVISDIMLMEKDGGKSGAYRRDGFF